MIRLLVVLLSVTVAMFAAKPKTQEFPATTDKVYTAAVQAAAQNFSLSYTDKDAHIVTFESGPSLAVASGYKITATISPSGDGSKINLSFIDKSGQTGADWGSTGRLAKKYFQAVQDALGASH